MYLLYIDWNIIHLITIFIDVNIDHVDVCVSAFVFVF